MKRPFLLLELLIAFSLVALFAFPLIFNPLNRLNQELKKLEAIEAHRLSEVLLSEVKEQLYLGTVPWKKIPTTKPEEPLEEFAQKKYVVPLGNPKKEREITFDAYIYWDKAPEKDTGGREFGLLTCELVTPEQTFTHKIFLFSYQGGAL